MRDMGVQATQDFEEEIFTGRINQKCDQLHSMCGECQFLNDKETCKCPKYFNDDIDLTNVVVICGKYKKVKKI